jgi:hypothetical protein
MSDPLSLLLPSFVLQAFAWVVKSLGLAGVTAVVTAVVFFPLLGKVKKVLSKPRVAIAVALGVIVLVLHWAATTPMPGTGRSDGGLPSARPEGDAIQASRQKPDDKPFTTSKTIRPNSSLATVTPGIESGTVVGSVSGFPPPLLIPLAPIPRTGVVVIPNHHPQATKPSHHAKPEGGHALAARAPAAAATHGGHANGLPGLTHGASPSASLVTPKQASPPAGMAGVVQGRPFYGGNAPQLSAAELRNLAKWHDFLKVQADLEDLNKQMAPMMRPYTGGGMPHVGMGHVSGGMGHPHVKQHHP